METTDEETIKEATTTKYTVNDGLLYHRTDEYSPWRLCLPKTPFRDTVIHDNHDLAIAGHPRYAKTYAKIARTDYWPNMSRTSASMYNNATLAKGQRQQTSLQQERGNHCRSPLDHGTPSEWISLDLYLNRGVAKT
jgi:hypothetical protein